MTPILARCFALLLTMELLFVANSAAAATIGRAVAGITRFMGQPSSQTIFIPQSATDYVTPPAQLDAVLQPTKTARAQARAVAGIDLAHGALFGATSTLARAEVIGATVRGYSQSLIHSEEIFQVRSNTLPLGTPVDVVVTPNLDHRGGAGTSGLGACCSIRSVYEFRITSSIVPNDSSYATGGPYLEQGILGGTGHDMEDIDFTRHFGSFTAQAIVGQNFVLVISLEMEAEALAGAVNDTDGHTHIGHSDSTAAAVLSFATEVFPSSSAAGLAAGDGPLPTNAGYLYQSTSGVRLPGLEALSAENVQSHFLPLFAVPEPSVILLAALSFACQCLVLRRRPPSGRK